jgi:hypothetical protein
MKSMIKIYPLMTVAILLVVSNLSPFIPERTNFSNDYQQQLFISWMERGSFDPAAPASISKEKIRTSYQNRQNGSNVKVEFELEDALIVLSREIVPDNIIRTGIPHLEQHYRYFLELFLFRLNSDQPFFVEDLASGLGVVIEIDGEYTETGNSLHHYIQGERAEWQQIVFAAHDNGYFYTLETSADNSIILQFPEYADLSSRLSATLRKEYGSEFIKRLKSERGDGHTIATLAKNYSKAYPESGRIPVSLPYHTGSSIPDRSLPLREYIETYRDLIWGLELIQNKIDDPGTFLTRELPWHKLQTSDSSYKLTAPPFRENITPDLELIKRELRDGMVFDTLEDYVIDENRIATLVTGDRISLSDLNDQEIEIITPFLNQLNAMHRVMGSRLLNFFLIPADVRTIFVLRDPERWVSEFVSYTDLILMLSHYWKDRIVHFGIERVKKVNNYVELNCYLAAVCIDSGEIDFAEVKFALSRSFRIDLAMMTLHTDVNPLEE